MLIDEQKCIGCSLCLPYCPSDAIRIIQTSEGKKAYIDQVLCLECGNCIRPRVVKCPTKAIYEAAPDNLSPGRKLRRFFSDPSTTHPLTGVPGRGTEEVKTNDVTGRVCRGELGICLEMGRPCVGTGVREIEKVTMALAELGIGLEACNPLSEMIDDPRTGVFKPEYLEESFVSAIVEFTIPFERGAELLTKCRALADEVDTVFSLDLMGCYSEDGTLPALELCKELGIAARPNCKVNLGMGRPYTIER